MARPIQQPYERRSETVRARVTIAERESVAHEARLHGVSEAEYVRRRLGFGGPAAPAQSTSSLVKALEKRGVDVAELLSRAYVQEQAKESGLSEAGLVRHMLEFAAAPPAKRQTAALISELNTLWRELRSVGVNANQLALATHTDRRFAVSWERVVELIDERCTRVETAIEKVLDEHD